MHFPKEDVINAIKNKVTPCAKLIRIIINKLTLTIENVNMKKV